MFLSVEGGGGLCTSSVCFPSQVGTHIGLAGSYFFHKISRTFEWMVGRFSILRGGLDKRVLENKGQILVVVVVVVAVVVVFLATGL